MTSFRVRRLGYTRYNVSNYFSVVLVLESREGTDRCDYSVSAYRRPTAISTPFTSERWSSETHSHGYDR